MDFLLSLAAFLAAITLLVFIHEYGHFKAARLCGVKVKRFSIGFGKPFWSRVDRHGTEWALAPFPVGGYISMVDSRVEAPAPGEEGMAFDGKPLWKRAAIVVAGPLANLLFAWGAWSALLMAPTMELAPRLGAAIAGSAADKAGFRPDDLILSVSGTPARTLGEAHLALTRESMAGSDSRVVVERSGGRAELALPTAELDPGKMASGEGLRQMGFANPGAAMTPARVKSVIPGGPAHSAGLKAGDKVIALDGSKISTWSEMAAVVATHADKPMAFEVQGVDGSARKLTLTPRVPTGSADGSPKIGAAADMGAMDPATRKIAFVSIARGPMQAMVDAADRCAKFSKMTYQAIGSMFSGRSGADAVSGPVGIAKQAGDAAESGPLGFGHFLAYLSLSLFLMNLLPLPGLDGGHLAQFAIEGVIRRPLSDRAQAAAAKLGFSVLGALMVFALLNDIAKLLR